MVWIQFSKNIYNLTEDMVQLGVDGPNNCSCPARHANKFEEAFHRDHIEYNQTIWMILFEYDFLDKMREILEADLLETSDTGPEYGLIARKDYAKALIDNFLCLDPKWCKRC
jgi:hypothetical protein